MMIIIKLTNEYGDKVISPHLAVLADNGIILEQHYRCLMIIPHPPREIQFILSNLQAGTTCKAFSAAVFIKKEFFSKRIC